MADRFYSVSLGEQTDDQVTEGATTSGEPIELRVQYDAAGMDKISVLLALETLMSRITKDNWPPV